MYLPGGDDDCQCLAPGDALSSNAFGSDAAAADLNSYGFGCAPHDTLHPLRKGCNPENPQQWCLQPWCYIDHERCRLPSLKSTMFEDRHFSYATCGSLDYFSQRDFRNVRGKTLKAAYPSNSGGWKGAYHPDGSYFIDNRWRGPIVDFVNQAAFKGGFFLEQTKPPDWLRNQSRAILGRSNHDFCVYAAALGFVDLCVGSFTINAERSAVADPFVVYSEGVYLVSFADEGADMWRDVFSTVVRPFTLGTWLMFWAVCVPMLGLLMVYHEYGQLGTVFSKTKPVLVRDPVIGDERVKEKKVPLWFQMGKAVYMVAIAFFTMSYEHSVITSGGKVHLLAVVSLIFFMGALYTANLAAIFTTNAKQQNGIDSIEAAIQVGYNFCAQRRLMDIIVETKGIDKDHFVPDPVDLGGDGQPGFICPNCKSRSRVFEYMRRAHSTASLYCNAALVLREDLEAFQMKGAHCDKAVIGVPVTFIDRGVYMSSAASGGLSSALIQAKYSGDLQRAFVSYGAESRCPVAASGAGTSLTVHQLAGVWVVVFTFAVAGLLTKWIKQAVRTKKERSSPAERSLKLTDQWGHPADHEIVVNGRVFNNITCSLRTYGANHPQNLSFENGLHNFSLSTIGEHEEEDEKDISVVK